MPLALAAVIVLAAGAPPDPASADWFRLQKTYSGEALLDQFGFALQAAGDVNGDGFADFLVGANVNDAAAPGGGRAYLYLGGAVYPAAPALAFAGAVDRENAGAAVHGGADLDSDGFDDWVVGAPGPGAGGTAPGRVYVFLGGAAPDSVPDLVVAGTVPGGQFGAAVLLVPDLDGDGYADLVVGAPRAGDGRVYIYRGGPRPLDATPDRVLHARPGDARFGRALAYLPDAGGDGRDELVVGVPRNSQAATWAGAVLVYLGTAALDTIPSLALLGQAAGDEFGSSLAAGADVNGDGNPDLLVGAPSANAGALVDAGKAYLFFAGAALDAAEDRTFLGGATEDRFGTSVALGFDWDGDGAADIAVGAPDHDAGGFDAGACFVFRGGAALDTTADATVAGTAANQHVGTAIGCAGDVRRNGRGALLVGGYNSSDKGRALLYGSDAAPTGIAAWSGEATGARLLPAAPNPFHPRVETRLEIDAPGFWDVSVFDARGRRVARILAGLLVPGRHRVVWDGRDARGRLVAAGTYRIRASGAATSQAVAVTLVR